MKRGFGSPNYDRAKQQAAASKGGKAAHANGTAHEFAAGDEARSAARRSVELRAERKAAQRAA